MSKTIKVSEETYAKIKDQLIEDESKPINNLEDIIGETFVFQCARYIYHGEVKSVNSTYIELKNASVVFDTGDYANKEAEDKQALPNNCFVLRGSIEVFYKLNW